MIAHAEGDFCSITPDLPILCVSASFHLELDHTMSSFYCLSLGRSRPQGNEAQRKSPLSLILWINPEAPSSVGSALSSGPTEE